MSLSTMPFDSLSKFTDKVMRGTLLGLTTRIIVRSPVDTGRFRNNWFASFGSPSSKTTGSADKSGSKAMAATQAAIGELQAGQTFYLTNNLPYSLPLEYGSSKQAPNGMLRISVAEVQRAIDSQVVR